MAKSKEIDISMGAEALKENGYFCLEQKKWKLAKQYFEKALEISPRNSYLYIGILLAKYKLKNMDLLPQAPENFAKANNYKLALQYADEELKLKLSEYVKKYKAILEEKYQKAIESLSVCQTIDDYKICYETFLSLGKHKEAELYAGKAREFIDQLNYDYCVEKMKQTLTEKEYLELYTILSGMEYKNSTMLASQCNEAYNTLKTQRKVQEGKAKAYSKAVSEMRTAKSGVDYARIKKTLEEIADYKNSRELIQQCDEKIKQYKIPLFFYNLWNNNVAMIILSAILLISSFFIFSGDLLMFIIISEVIGIGFSVVIFISAFKDEENQNSLGKVVLIATIASFVFGLLLGLICGVELYPYIDGLCSACGGDGIFNGKICPLCGGWGNE